MNRYIRVYKEIWKLNAAKLMIYRGNILNSALVSILFAAFSVFSISVLTSRNPIVFGWTRDELLVLTGVYSIIIGLFHVLFTRNLEQLSRIVHRGQLDPVLLKPIDPQFLLSVSVVNFSGIPRVICALIFVFYELHILHIPVTMASVIQLTIFSFVGLATIYFLWFGIIAITVWQSQLFNLSDLLFHVTDALKYPSDMYGELRYYITLFLFPLSLIITLPTKAILIHTSFVDLLVLMLFCIFAAIFSRKMWKFVLRFYTSASS